MKVQEAVEMLKQVAVRALSAEPQQHWIDKEAVEFYVQFTTDERRKLAMFVLENSYLSNVGKHPIMSFMREQQSCTLSLAERLQYALSGKHISASYVTSLAHELAEHTTTLGELADLNSMMR
jgi:hypothetical protein